MSTYLDYESIQTSGTYTYFEQNLTPADPNTITDVTVESIDAAASSLQLGTDILETQVVEIGSAEVTTTIYGPMNILHAINASSLALDYDLNVGGNTILHNLSAAELTSTRLDTGIVNATSLNVDGTALLGTLYAGNCSLMNVSTARIDAEQLTVKGNCSMFNVSMVRIDANTLTANDTVSSAKLNVVNVLTSAPIPTAYTTVSAAVGTDIQLSSLTSVTPNGAFGPAGDYYSYSSSNVPEFNKVNGTLDTSYKVFAQTTYRVCISVNYANNAANLSFQDDAGTLYTLGLTNTLTTYILYLKATVNSPLYLTVFRSATSGLSVEIELASLSVEPWCETNVTTLNATGSALLASSGGVVGIGTTQPAYTLDVSGTMKVTGVAIFDNLTLQNLSIQDFTTTNITTPLASTTQTIGPNITTGSISIAGGMTTSGTVNIGNAMTTSTGGINIGTTLTTGSLNIGSATGTTKLRGTVLANTLNTINTTDALAIGTGNTGGITIGGTTLALNPATVNINTVAPTNNLKQTTIGATSGLFDTNTALNGKTSISKLASALNPVYSYPVSDTLSIGYSVFDTITGTSLSTNGFNDITNFITLSAGVWLIHYSIRITSTADAGVSIFTIWGNESVDASIFYAQNGIATGVTTRGLIYNGSFVVVSTGSNSYKIRCYSQYSGSTLNIVKPTTAEYSMVRRTRIA